MHVFIHTDQATQPPPPGSEFVLHTGVSNEPSFSEPGLNQGASAWNQHKDKARGAWMRQQARKYEWAFQTARARGAPEPWLLADTDIIIQCSAAALRRRFAEARTDLLIGAEENWWPNPDPTRTQVPYPYRGVPLRFPNSGLLLGTQRGFERLVVQLRRLSRDAWVTRIGRAWRHWPGLALPCALLLGACVERARPLHPAHAQSRRHMNISQVHVRECHPGASRAARASIRGTSRASAGSTTRRACTPRCRAARFTSSRTTRASTSAARCS